MDVHVLVNLSNSFRKCRQDAMPCSIVNSYEIYYTRLRRVSQISSEMTMSVRF